MDPAVTIALAVAALAFVGWLMFHVARMAFVGAQVLFVLALGWSFVGLTAYVLCWIFLFPVMLTACLVMGFLAWTAEKLEQEEGYSGG